MNTAIQAAVLQVGDAGNSDAPASERIPSRSIDTVCAYCGTGCGITTTGSDDQTQPLAIAGSKDHPTNFGRICSKGSALNETLDLSARLLQPEVDGQFCGWDEALTATASRLRAIIDAHGPDAVALYCSGQMLTEDYYVANKLMKGYIGSANIDTNSRLCMSSTVAGHKRAFGSDTVPGCYEDLELAELVVLTGSNTAWCHPVLFQRIRAAKEAHPGRKVVVIDPRRTATCDIADLHLQLQPGSDGYLFNGLLSYLNQADVLDQNFIEQHTNNFSQALEKADEYTGSIASVAEHCGLAEADVAAFYQWFAETQQSVTVFSQGINQSSSGTDKVNAIINCHLATGRIGKPGMGPLSFTGQPNAMGGREVGGLANQLAAHLDLENPEHQTLVKRFWNAPNMATQPGLKAVDLFDAINDGTVKAVWVIATNPVVSLPDADKVKAALGRCELVIQSDCMAETDTGAYADIRLPALGWGEKDGMVTNSERRISRQRAVFPPTGEARPDWLIISQVAQKLGFNEGFNYQSVHEVFDEHARLSAFENSEDGVRRDFNLQGLTGLSKAEFDSLQPIQWPVLDTPDPRTHGQVHNSRLFADGQFFTASRRANFLAITPRKPANAPDSSYPLILNTGRIRDQWHTMTRTGLSAKLSGHLPEPFVEVHPGDAERFDLSAGALARIESRWGSMLARVQITDAVTPGQLFVPMHWTAQYSTQGRLGPVVNPVVDPVSGQPESKHTPTRISPYKGHWYGFLLSRQRPDTKSMDTEYQVRSVAKHHHRLELADSRAAADWAALKLASGLTSSAGQTAADESAQQILEYSDPTTGEFRAASIANGRLEAVLMIAPSPALPERDWLASLFAQEPLTGQERNQLLSGKPPSGSNDCGPTVCACFGVGRNTICQAIDEQSLDSPEAIGTALKAGTNCGSCIPELRQLLSDATG